MPTYPKHSKKPRISSIASNDKRPKSPQMSMDRKVTRTSYEAREIDQGLPDPQQRRKENEAALKAVQSKMKPIRSGQK